jgi:hypothetical protein
VTIKSGLVVSVPALRLLWQLEAADMVIKIDDRTGRLLVGPTARLTADDTRAIREHRDELIELVKMCTSEAM